MLAQSKHSGPAQLAAAHLTWSREVENWSVALEHGQAVLLSAGIEIMLHNICKHNFLS